MQKKKVIAIKRLTPILLEVSVKVIDELATYPAGSVSESYS